MNFRFLIIVFLTFFVCNSIAVSQQNDDDVIARIGTRTITKEQFIERYEFTPLLGKQPDSKNESLKLDFLYTLIAEKLWALQAQRLRLDTTEVMKFAKAEFEKMFVRDELYKKEITDKIKITPEELIQGNYRNVTDLQVRFIFSEDENEINNVYKLLKEGVEFDTVLSAREEFDEQDEPIDVVYGQMDDAVEDSLYKLAVGEFTTPILTPDGWYIFKLENKIHSVLNTLEEKEEAKANVEKIIKARKSRILYRKFFLDFFKDEKVDVNPELFESLAEKISARYKWKKDNNIIDKNNLLNLLSDDVLFIESEFGVDSLKQIFISFKESPFSLKYFIRLIAFDGFPSENSDLPGIRKLLDAKTRSMIERELLAREGIKRGYLSLPEVQSDINTWTDNYLFQMLQNKFLDSVTVRDAEVYELYRERNREEKYPREINIREILVNNDSLAYSLRKRIDEGEDFKQLAKKYTQRETTKNTGGEFGFFPPAEHNEIGKIASGMKIGQVYGPLKIKEGYSIFKLIGKRDTVTIPPKPFSNFKEEYTRELLHQKAKVKVDNYTVGLALKFGVGVDFDLFNSIDVTSINSFGIRRLGFGGKLTAVPLLAPNADWVQPWLKKLQIVQ